MTEVITWDTEMRRGKEEKTYKLICGKKEKTYKLICGGKKREDLPVICGGKKREVKLDTFKRHT